MSRHVYSSCHCFSHLTSVVLPCVHLTISKSAEQCTCIKFWNIRTWWRTLINEHKQHWHPTMTGFHHFTKGWMSIKSDKDRKCPSTSRNNKSAAQVYDLVRNMTKDWPFAKWLRRKECLMTHYLAILPKDLEKRCSSVEFIPWLLTQEQTEKQCVCGFWLSWNEETDENLLKVSLTGYETWVYNYDPKTKHLQP
jgi:hypothetical protein